MRTLTQAKFVLLVFFAFSCSLAFAKTHQCDPENRPKSDDCYKEPLQNSCAYYENNCPRKICAQNAFNGCDACSDPDVLYYKTGECNPDDIVLTCREGVCDPAFDAQKILAYDPVCGIKQGRNHRQLVKTFDNVCDLCEKSSYHYYQTGTCKIDREYCDNGNTDNDNNNSNDPVCAAFTTEDFGSVYTTVPSASEACSDKAVDFYTEGACGTLRDNTTYCLPNYRPDACTLDYNPVCGFYKDEDGNLQHKIKSNACTACADSEILYHQPGPCIFSCDLNPNVIYECAGVLEPVCGTYEVNGEERKVSLRNGCIGCYYSGKRILNYTDGLCPGDDGIRCENDAGAFAEGFLHPVCGYSTEDCNSDSCRQTYAEPILACTNTDNIWYSLRACPGDGGVSCDNYRTRPNQPDRVYENVCGYTEQDCSNSSCRENYDDQYDACRNGDVIYFTNGPC